VLTAQGLARHWREGLSVGIGLHLLLGSSKAAAAGVELRSNGRPMPSDRPGQRRLERTLST